MPLYVLTDTTHSRNDCSNTLRPDARRLCVVISEHRRRGAVAGKILDLHVMFQRLGMRT